ncbi:hypothetical protein [Pedobacter glucosidilyticus]|uniref:hypothetical protein n=1 Tax=Pedobacter glucosidilyticus TaxID=1122941 RepID=UPI0003FB66FB|nr:hypothetical protein [Pedobacter glucosidilyticus]
MKQLIKCWLALCFVIALFFQSTFAQTTTYQIKRKYNLKDAYHFKADHGFVVFTTDKTSSTKFSVSVETAESFYIQIPLICGGAQNRRWTIYKSFVTEQDIQDGTLQHSGEEAYFYYKSFRGDYYCGIASTDNRNFYQNMAYIAEERIVGAWWTWGKPIDVIITLTLEGNAKLSDIRMVKTPGTEALYAKDFINGTTYTINHDCYNSNTGVCNELNKVRSIPDVTKTDVVIQAHRGVWGKPNTNQENTKGAMIAANSLGIKVLESDIMPVNVRDGGTYVDSLSGKPEDLACFHDFILTRYTNENNNANRIYNKTKSYLEGLNLKKPRSIDDGLEKIMFFEELINYAADNNLIVCVDMKNLEPKGSGGSCTELCGWQDDSKKKQSLYHNLKFAINSTDITKLKNMAIKTYATYNELKANLTTGDNLVPVERFNKVLWAPIIAASNQWKREGDISGAYDPLKIQKFLDDWFAHNETVLYYETNFFNDFDGKTSVMLSNSFSFADGSMVPQGYNVMEYIYRMTGRRAGIFSEEPVGGKGTVNRWGSWGIKNPVNDRRGDHLWLLKKPFFKHAVITTDRPDQWIPLND